MNKIVYTLFIFREKCTKCTAGGSSSEEGESVGEGGEVSNLCKWFGLVGE